MAFNENNVMWNTEEIRGAAALDRVYEAVSGYLKEHPKLDTSDVIGLLGLLAKNHVADLVTFIRYLFFENSEGYRGVIGRLVYLLCMLERDNDLIAPNDE